MTAYIAQQDSVAPARWAVEWSGFFRGDPDYAPFGIDWLRGVTPLRLAFFLALGTLQQARTLAYAIAIGGFHWGVMWSITMALMRWLPLMVLVIQAERRTRDDPLRRRVAWIAAAIAAGVLVSQCIGMATMVFHPFSGYVSLRKPGEELDPLLWHLFFSQMATLSCYGGILAAALCLETRQRRADEAAHDARASRVALERQAAEAELRLLDAQIEPHFLFNTLACARRLAESSPKDASSLLRDLIAYLKEAVPGARGTDATLGAEMAKARSFLAIFKVRMGDRLQFSIDIPEPLHRVHFPPLMLGTLVENAIKHGVGPRGSGGAIRISARSVGDMLEVEVSDDGIGFRAHSGNGVGLANVRARLAALYGTRGTLRLARNSGGGITATLRLPRQILPRTSPS
jgi:signal transduction histidine kinase